jgi:two-component system CheB/CheR fusion protein
MVLIVLEERERQLFAKKIANYRYQDRKNLSLNAAIKRRFAELTRTNASLQEELKSINEELQSTNEELQSTNEELTTSKKRCKA